MTSASTGGGHVCVSTQHLDGRAITLFVGPFRCLPVVRDVEALTVPGTERGVCMGPQVMCEPFVALSDGVEQVVRETLDACSGKAEPGVSLTVAGTEWVGSVTVSAGVIDEASELLFTNGQCHALALALFEQTGWRPVLLIEPCVDDEDCSWETPDVCSCQIVHVVSEDEQGKLWDIYGPSTFDELLDRYDGHDYMSLLYPDAATLEQVLVFDESWRRPAVFAARAFIEPLLSAHR
jgi:hypothetical protein